MVASVTAELLDAYGRSCLIPRIDPTGLIEGQECQKPDTCYHFWKRLYFTADALDDNDHDVWVLINRVRHAHTEHPASQLSWSWKAHLRAHKESGICSLRYGNSWQVSCRTNNCDILLCNSKYHTTCPFFAIARNLVSFFSTCYWHMQSSSFAFGCAIFFIFILFFESMKRKSVKKK